MGVEGWPIWEKEVSEFPYAYDEPEACHFLESDVTAPPDGGKPVRKHYRFGWAQQ